LEKEREKKQKEDEKKVKELEKEREKKQKEEERKAKELEKEKQKEEKLFREEMEKKKNEKVKAAFVGFFKQKCSNLDISKKDEEFIDQEQKTYFMPFQVKSLFLVYQSIFFLKIGMNLYFPEHMQSSI